VFDMAFFSGPFAERVRAFSHDYKDANVRLEVVTLTGERLDTLQLSAVESGTRLSTRDERLVFVPYAHIAHLDVAILKDHRIAGFELSVGSEQAPPLHLADRG
jgi:hypothetical protein